MPIPSHPTSNRLQSSVSDRKTPRYAAASEVVWRKLNFNPVADADPNVIESQLAREVGYHRYTVFQFDLEYRIGERLSDDSLYLDDVLLCQSMSLECVSKRGQNLHTIAGHGHRIFEVSRKTAVGRTYRPTVTIHPGCKTACVHHGLYSNREANLHRRTGFARPIVWHFGLFVQVATDPVPDKLANDRVAKRLNVALNCVPHTPQRPSNFDRANSFFERLTRRVEQSAGFLANTPYRKSTRSVAIPAVQDGTTINTYDIAFLQDSLIGNPVNNLIVDRSTDSAGKRSPRVPRRVRIPLEGRNCSAASYPRLGVGVQVGDLDARPYALGQAIKDFGDDSARLAHFFDLGAGLEPDE